MTKQAALIADIGGTHARFALLLPDQSIVHTNVIAGGDFKSMADLCRHYLNTVPDDYIIRHAAWAVAGAMINGVQTITNRGWSFSIAEIQAEFGWDTFQIINDFAALALAVPHLTDDDKILVKPGTADTSAPIAIIGPGTGLGVAGLVPLPDHTWHALPGEGGHVTLPADNEFEARIVAYLKETYGLVIAERVLSGQGLVNLYQAMAAQDGVAIDRYPTPQAVREAAMDEGDPLALRVLDQFCQFLGAVAGNAALTLGARGGVYLAGGILPRMVDFLCASPFSQRFTQKGVVAPYLETIPVWLVTHPLPAFVGLRFLLQSDGIVKTG